MLSRRTWLTYMLKLGLGIIVDGRPTSRGQLGKVLDAVQDDSDLDESSQTTPIASFNRTSV